MIIEGLDKITFANGILRISTRKIGGSGQEESSGELLIPGPSVQLVLNGLIEEEDHVIFFNFRTDRGRQLTRALTQEDFPD